MKIEPGPLQKIAPTVKFGEGVKVYDFVNLYGCEIGDQSKIGTFVEIQKGAKIGRNCKISSHTFICEGVTIEDDVFIGHNVTFINDMYPRSTVEGGGLQTEADWVCIPTLIKKGRLGRLQHDGPRRRDGGGEGDRGRGKRGDERRPPGDDRGREPGEGLAKNHRGEEKDESSLPGPESPVRADPRGDRGRDPAGARQDRLRGRPVRRPVRKGVRSVLRDASSPPGSAAARTPSGWPCWVLGIGPGDEVITVPDTFIATAEAISWCGAKPVFVDVDPATYNMDPSKVEAAITKKTKAIIPVHLFGQMADMDPILEIAKKRKLFVIEDASQAHGAEYKGKKAGSIGDAGCFSFYPGKNLGAYGEAGAVVTNNEELDKKMRMLRDHGQAKKYYHSLVGWNARMDGIQGAILSVKLKHLPAWTEGRRRNAALYGELLKGVKGVTIPKEAAYGKHVYHIYAIRVADRDRLIAALAEKDIHCGIHYPIPVHLLDAYKSLNLGKGSYPVAEKSAAEFVSLPMFPELKMEQIGFTVDMIKENLRNI